MKKILGLIAGFMLCSCIDVDDLGGYWEKGVVDAALEGTWSASNAPNADTEKWRFTKEGNAYRFDKINRDGSVEQEALEARSIDMGPYRFLMARDRQKPNGILCRYVAKDGVIEQYFLKDKAVTEWLKANHPAAKNISVRPASEVSPAMVKILMLDEESAKILSAIPDTPEFWEGQITYRKLAK